MDACDGTGGRPTVISQQVPFLLPLGDAAAPGGWRGLVPPGLVPHLLEASRHVLCRVPNCWGPLAGVGRAPGWVSGGLRPKPWPPAASRFHPRADLPAGPVRLGHRLTHVASSGRPAPAAPAHSSVRTDDVATGLGRPGRQGYRAVCLSPGSGTAGASLPASRWCT